MRLSVIEAIPGLNAQPKPAHDVSAAGAQGHSGEPGESGQRTPRTRCELAPAPRTQAAQEMQEAERAALAHVRTVWWYGVGSLWLLDALLQAQPRMFSGGVVNMALLPAAQGQPTWIAGPMQWGVRLWMRQPALWNTLAVGLELLIGCLVLMGTRRRHRAWGRTGLWLSIVWGLIVWFFGQGFGGLFTGSATYLAGAPGSAFLYIVLAIALLLPESRWQSPRLLWAMRSGGAVLFAVGALLQLAPLYWSPLGLASVLESEVMMPLPFGLAALQAPLIASMANAPTLWNLALIGILLVPAAALLVAPLFARGSRIFYLLALAWLVALWIVFQGYGMVFSGMATDPNTAPLWLLLLVPGWLTVRQVHASTRG